MGRCSPRTSAVNASHACGAFVIGVHLDEMYVKLNGEMVYLWRAVDHEGEILESYITKTRDKSAALAFIKKTLKRHGKVEKITTEACAHTGRR